MTAEYLYRRYFEITQKVLTLLEDEVKVRRVRDASYWGLPEGTPIVPGMKPVSGFDQPDAPDAIKPSTTMTKPRARITPTTSVSPSGDWLSADSPDKPKTLVMPGGRPGKDMVSQGKDSLWEHLEYNPETGETRPTAERQALWNGLVNEASEGVPKGQEAPVFTMLGGGGGSGKSLMQKQATGLTTKDETVRMDADDIKRLLFERDPAYQGLSKDERPAYLHEESSVIVKLAQRRALAAQQHFLLDGTGNSDLDKLEGKIKAARDAGYQVNGVYATVPTQLAWARNIKRALQDEHRGQVPASALGGAHSSVSAVAPQAAPDFDSFQLFDMASGEARLIATCKRGEEMEVLDQEAYDGFLSKDGIWTPAELEALRTLIPKEYLEAPLNDESALGPEWFDYGWMPSLRDPLFAGIPGDTKSGRPKMDDEDKAAILIAVVAKMTFEESGFPDTPEFREYWDQTVESVSNIPAGVGVDVPKEWPSDRYDQWLDAWGM